GAGGRTLFDVGRQVDSLRKLFEEPSPSAGAKPAAGASPRRRSPVVTKTVANRAADDLDRIRGVVAGWYKFYDGYDPVFSWWLKDPYAKLSDALTAYARTLREKIVGIRTPAAPVAGAERGQAAASNEPIIGDPNGVE